MIIHSLSTENLLKYSKLELKDLPERGLIAVSGQNESGKSSIGESICFALFGRSFSVGSDELDKLIRWGESSCSANLDFSAREGQRYRVSRFLDRDGNHSACLCKAEDPDNPIARGVDAVGRAMFGLLGYEFDEFIESFYLAQREITTPHPHSFAVKTMAGIAPLEICRAEFDEELKREQTAVEDAEARAADVAAQLEASEFDPARLESLEQERRQMADLDAAVDERQTALNAAVEAYEEREPKLRAAENSRSTASGMRLLFLLLGIAGLGLWVLLTQAPDSPLGQQVQGLLTQNIVGWQDGHALWLLYAGAAFTVLFFLFWIRVGSLGGRIRELREAGPRLKDELGNLDEMEPALALTSVPSDSDAGGEGEEHAVVKRPDPSVREQLARRLHDATAGAQEVRSTADQETGWLSQTGDSVKQRIAVLDSGIAAQRALQNEHTKLTVMGESLQQQVEEHQRRIRVRELANDLLLSAARHLSHRFNHNLRGLVGKTLPLFTEGRYEHLQIDEDLSVHAFSNEKRDFMDLDEISSGTQRQIMLALRLALSQELINRVVKSNQFSFLDEPFAFFDDRRTRSSLAVLPRLSDDITQIWVVAQQFPKDVVFDRHIECERKSDFYLGTDQIDQE
jgi:exonuclease SbcC